MNADLVGNYSIIDLLNQMRDFANCYFETCNWAATSSNKVADYMEKLSLADSGSTFVFYTDTLLTNYTKYDNEITDQINEIIIVIDSGRSPGILKNSVMKF